MKKQKISVRVGANIYGGGKEIETIVRKIYVDVVGNFNRVACRYKGRTYLVHSEAGDIGDPFRANDSYLNRLFIISDKPCQWHL